MPVGVRLRSAKKAVSMVKKGKAPGTDYSNNKTKLRDNKRDQNQPPYGKEEKVRRTELGQASERKSRRERTESEAFHFDDTVLKTVKRKHNREYGQGGKLQGKKERINFRNEEFSRRDNIHSKKEFSKGKVHSKDEISEEEDKDKENQGPVSELKVQRLPSRVLDKTGKKVRVNRKELRTGSVEKGDQVKRKRVIKIDPYDESNKRLDDTPLVKGEHFT